MKDAQSDSFEELAALDPLRVLHVHPKWRRVLGFAWFDKDPALQIGSTYEYRVTGFFPKEDSIDQVYGFHTVPSSTTLPAEFYLSGLRWRLPQPVKVQNHPEPSYLNSIQVSRQGIPLKLYSSTQFIWKVSIGDEWSLILDFPQPVSSAILELAEGHQLEYSASVGAAWAIVSDSGSVPPGPRPHLNFSSPIKQLRLKGIGFLFAVRIPSGQQGIEPLSIVLPPMTLINTPRPEIPLTAKIDNLQQPQQTPTVESEYKTPQPMHALGFRIQWRPALKDGLESWPQDANAAPPLSANLFEIQHRQEPAAKWNPVLEEENWTLGDRSTKRPKTQIHFGIDLESLFPEIPIPGKGIDLDLTWQDVFDFAEGGFEVHRPVPVPGTYHQYRIRSVDPVGRPSLKWRETNLLRLEKHIPPPLPVGPDETPASQPSLPQPMGVQARILIKDAPDLTSADKVLLGNDNNAIVLRWGWHKQQRDQDPFAREFRVYVSDKPLDQATSGTITNVKTIQGSAPATYEVSLKLDKAVNENAAQGGMLHAGHPFHIQKHSGGKLIQATLEAYVPRPDGKLPVPEKSLIVLPLPFTPDLTRPPAWTKRVEVQSITDENKYRAIIRNRLKLSPTNPRDAIWVGVSAADAQPYVSDQLPNENRPGNESAIVPVRCDGRYQTRPIFSVPPKLDPVPVLVTPEPEERPILFELDLIPYLKQTSLITTDMIRPERAPADAVFAAYWVTTDNFIMARVLKKQDPSETDVKVPKLNDQSLNPDDRKAIIQALNTARTDALEDRLVVFLADVHPYGDRLFEPVTLKAVKFSKFTETLPPKSGRYVYRVRKSEADHLSVGGAVAKVIVRVPSLTPGSIPEKLPTNSSDPPGALTLKIAADPELTHVLTFSQMVQTQSVPVNEAELLRVPNRPDLYSKGHGIRIRAPNGALLIPQLKKLTDPDITLDQGFNKVSLKFTAGSGERVRVWACSLTRDGIPSALGGPWSFAMPLPSLPTPTLSFSSSGTKLTFKWSWPPGSTYTVALERSADGIKWERISGPLLETTSEFTHTPITGIWQYRLRIINPDGRTNTSNTVTA
jgi:hypothetical protein